MLETVASIAQLIRSNNATNNSSTVSPTTQFYTSILEKIDNISNSLKKTDISSALKEIFPTQSILTTVKPILPTSKNVPFAPVLPVRNIADLEKTTLTAKADDKTNSTLDKLNIIIDKFRDVRHEASSQALTSTVSTTPEKTSFIEKKNRIEEDEDSIAADVKGIFNLLKKVFGDTGNRGSANKDTAIGGSDTSTGGIGGLIGGIAGLLLLRKYGNSIKNALTGKKSSVGGEPEPKLTEGTEPKLTEGTEPKLTEGPKPKPLLEDPETRFKNAKSIEGSVVEPEVKPTPKINEIVKDAKVVGTEASTLSKVGKIAGRAAVPLTVAAESYGAYTDIKEQTANIEAQQKEGKITTEEANVKKGETKGDIISKTAMRTAGGLAGAEAGALGGAALGTVVAGPVGTVVGGLIGGGIGYFAGQKVTDATGLTDKAGEFGKTVGGGSASNVTDEDRKKNEDHLKELRAASDAKARDLGFKDQQDQVNAIKSGLVKPGEHKPNNENVKRGEEGSTKTINLEPIKESSVKEKAGPIEDNSTPHLKVIADNTNKTNASIQGLTAGIYKLAEAIAKGQGGKAPSSMVSFSPSIQQQDGQQEPSASDYAASYSSPGQHVRQKAFNSFNR